MRYKKRQFVTTRYNSLMLVDRKSFVIIKLILNLHYSPFVGFTVINT